MAQSTDAGTWIIEWHTNAGSLSYAVISGPSPGEEVHGHVRAGGDSKGRIWAYLSKPDGTEIPILDSGRVFQVSGTNVIETSQRISASNFQAFVNSHATDYSLPALLKFAGKEK